MIDFHHYFIEYIEHWRYFSAQRNSNREPLSPRPNLPAAVNAVSWNSGPSINPPEGFHRRPAAGILLDVKIRWTEDRFELANSPVTKSAQPKFSGAIVVINVYEEGSVEVVVISHDRR
jgi:hypothetical protein